MLDFPAFLNIQKKKKISVTLPSRHFSFIRNQLKTSVNNFGLDSAVQSKCYSYRNLFRTWVPRLAWFLTKWLQLKVGTSIMQQKLRSFRLLQWNLFNWQAASPKYHWGKYINSGAGKKKGVSIPWIPIIHKDFNIHNFSDLGGSVFLWHSTCHNNNLSRSSAVIYLLYAFPIPRFTLCVLELNPQVNFSPLVFSGRSAYVMYPESL